jgi:O-antigen ligase
MHPKESLTSISPYFQNIEKVPTWPLLVLMVSLFYCLPLGRFSIGGFDSDFRVYDYIFPLVYGYYLSMPQVYRHFKRLLNSKILFTNALWILVILVFVSIFISVSYSGFEFFLPRMIRFYRLLAYFTLPMLVIAVLSTERQVWRAYRVFFWTTAFVALIAFAQGLELIPSLWPEYWLNMYSESDAPVATLSPHHKHIGVIMLVGIFMGLAYLSLEQNMIWKVIIGLIISIMVVVPIFGGTRTFALGLAGALLAYLFIQRGKAIVVLSLSALGVLVYFQFGGEKIKERIEEKYEERVSSRIEKLGYAGVYQERTVIYEDIIGTLSNKPYLLITGTGFQNIFKFIGANGAHNNYLHVLMELGLVGFIFFITFLSKVWQNLYSMIHATNRRIQIVSSFMWVTFCGVLFTMFVGETFWAQAAMFTLAGQLSFVFGLSVAPLYWINQAKTRVKLIK